MADNYSGAPGGTGHPAVPKCSAEYAPTTGGWEGGTIEGDGMPGDKGEAGPADTGITGNQEDGQYNYQTFVPFAQSHLRPTPTPDPDYEGPRIGVTAGPNGDVDMGDRSPGGSEPNEPQGY